MGSIIHERALVSESALIGEGSDIGPNVYIGPEVVIGKNCRIMANAYIDGCTEIGDGTQIYPSAVIGTITQAKAFSGGKSGVVIGKNNIIREFATINSTEGDRDQYTRIGDNNLIMAYCHVAHHCFLHNNIVMSNAVNLAGHVEVFDNAILGGLAAVHQFVRIGRFSIIGGKSKVVKDIVPYVKIDGNPSKVVGLNLIAFQRNNFSQDRVDNLKEAYKILFRQGHNVSQAVEVLYTKENEEALEFAGFIKSSERGILFKTICQHK